MERYQSGRYTNKVSAYKHGINANKKDIPHKKLQNIQQRIQILNKQKENIKMKKKEKDSEKYSSYRLIYRERPIS